MIDILREFCETPAPVGRERAVQDLFEHHMKKYTDEIERDKIGNLVARLNGADKHYALVAHADEVGFLVSHIDANGFIQAKWNTQGHLPDLRLLPGQRIEILADDARIPGFFAVKTAHIAGPKGKKKIPSFEEVFLDIGVNSEDEARELGVNIGDPVVYDARVTKVGKHLVGKSMDDRVGLVASLEVAEKLSERGASERPTVTFVSTVMEEIGAKGAAAIANRLNVDGVIVLEVGLADDYPCTSNEAGVSLGKGPVVVIKDSQIHYSHELNQEIISSAELNDRPIQRAVYHNYATDGFRIASLGQRVSAIGVPCRYTHSSFETIDPDDLKSVIDLVFEYLSAVSP